MPDPGELTVLWTMPPPLAECSPKRGVESSAAWGACKTVGTGGLRYTHIVGTILSGKEGVGGGGGGGGEGRGGEGDIMYLNENL